MMDLKVIWVGWILLSVSFFSWALNCRGVEKKHIKIAKKVEGDFWFEKQTAKSEGFFTWTKHQKLSGTWFSPVSQILDVYYIFLKIYPFPTASNIQHEFGIGKTQGQCPTISDRPGWCSSWWILWCCLWKWWGFNRDMKRRPGLFVKNGNLKLSRLNISPQFWTYSSI